MKKLRKSELHPEGHGSLEYSIVMYQMETQYVIWMELPGGSLVSGDYMSMDRFSRSDAEKQYLERCRIGRVHPYPEEISQPGMS